MMIFIQQTENFSRGNQLKGSVISKLSANKTFELAHYVESLVLKMEVYTAPRGFFLRFITLDILMQMWDIF